MTADSVAQIQNTWLMGQLSVSFRMPVILFPFNFFIQNTQTHKLSTIGWEFWYEDAFHWGKALVSECTQSFWAWNFRSENGISEQNSNIAK